MRLNQATKISLLKKVVAHKVHVATFNSKQMKFDLASQAINGNPNLQINVKGCTVQEKFNSMLATFKKKDERARVRTGKGGERSKADKLIAGVLEAVEDVYEINANEKMETERAEARKRSLSAV